ncbi:MAG: hemerythrin domain-containing protein [Acidobacteriia bacterium]|nr:hemerythrin domain-containing protein [Terriglobia bacterium]
MTTQIKAHATEELRHEHQSVLQLLNEMNRVLDSADLSVTVSWKPFFEDALKYFKKDVATHFKKEEDALFPALERYIGREGGPIAVMLNEHQQHNALLVKLNEAVAAGDLPGLRSVWENFNPLLTMHIVKEDSVLFPMAEHMLTEEEWSRVGRRMEELNKAH